MIRLLLEPVNLLILDEPTNHLDMPSKDVLKEAIKAFDGTAIIVSHDREFLDGLVTKVYEFGGGKVREHLGGIYDFLQSRNIESLDALGAAHSGQQPLPSNRQETAGKKEPSEQDEGKMSYMERKERQKKLRKAEKAVEDAEMEISRKEQRIKELDSKLLLPENASNMDLVNEYADLQRQLDELVERWEQLSEELEDLEKTV